ncbi:MAG TPA: hypothetical protein VIB79_27895 [Candidatus Binatia bacterium]|jgi:hypothetical protein
MEPINERINRDRVAATLPESRETTYRTITAGSVVEALGGIGVVALAIIALAGIIPRVLAPIAVIAFGVALAAEGSSIASRYAQLVRYDGGAVEKTEIGGGAGSEVLGGVAGIVLGILALIGEAPTVLISAAAITFGAALLLGAGTEARLSSMVASSGHWMAGDALTGSAGAEVLVGIGAITLGILALTGIAPMTLNLVALLTLGAGAVIEGAAVGGSMLAVWR